MSYLSGLFSKIISDWLMMLLLQPLNIQGFGLMHDKVTKYINYNEQLRSHKCYFSVVQPLFLFPTLFSLHFFFLLLLLLLLSHLLPFTVRLHCRAVPVHSLATALRLCGRVASPSAGV